MASGTLMRGPSGYFRSIGALMGRGGEQPIEHRAKCLPAMAHLPFSLRGGFAEGAAEGRVIEEGIVAEAIRAARLAGDFALDRAAKGVEQLATIHEGDDANIAGGADGRVLELFEQEAVIGFAGGLGTGKAGGIDSGSAAEGIGFEAGIFGKQEAGGVFSVVARFQNGVL